MDITVVFMVCFLFYFLEMGIKCYCRVYVIKEKAHIHQWFKKCYIFILRKVLVTQSCLTLWPHGLLCPWNSPGKNTEVDSHSLLQGIFQTPGIKPRSPALQMDSLPSELSGKPHILLWGFKDILRASLPIVFSENDL